jgi:hypothetical protein
LSSTKRKSSCENASHTSNDGPSIFA